MSCALMDCLTEVSTFYREQLRASARAVAYLKGRGLRGDVASLYGLGYAPAGFQTLRTALPNCPDSLLQRAGLSAVSESGRRYDRFRDRIMFPIQDDHGCVIGFGGRVLEGDGAKYLNSPETEVFHKGHVLFGLPQAAESVLQTGVVYVVEGYLDVVSLAQHGVQNVVATLGTAATGPHLECLLGLAKRVVFCFDGDEPGMQASVRALDMCLAYVTDDVEISFSFLPDGHDPDTYVRAKGADAFNELALVAPSFDGFFLACIVRGCQLTHAEGRARLVATALPRLRQIKALGLRHRLLASVASLSRISFDELIELF